MKQKKNRSRIFGPFLYGRAGFTLVEVMLVMVIIFGLAGVTALGIIRFIGSASDEMKSSEAYEIQQGVSAYIASGNTIAEPFMITPIDQGVLDPYISGNLKSTWMVNVDGKVVQVDSTVQSGLVPQ